MPDYQDHTRWQHDPGYEGSLIDAAARQVDHMNRTFADGALQRAVDQARREQELIQKQVSAAQSIEQQTQVARAAFEAVLQAQPDPAIRSHVAAIDSVLRQQAEVLHEAQQSAAALVGRPISEESLAFSAVEAYSVQARLAQASMQAAANDDKLQAYAAEVQQLDSTSRAASQAIGLSKDTREAVANLHTLTRLGANESIAALLAESRRAMDVQASSEVSEVLRQLDEAAGRSLAVIRDELAKLPSEQARAASDSLRIVQRALVDQATVEAWLTSPHEDLGGLSPLGAIRSGGAAAVEGMLQAALEGIPS